MSNCRLSIIVVSYNTKDLTIECLKSIFDQTKLIPFELIVWDNSSTDGSQDAIEGNFGDKLTLVRGQENLGFAAANNCASKLAKGDLLLLLNPDTVVLDEAIETLVSFAEERPKSGIWGGRTLFKDGTLNPSSCWGRQTLWSLFCQASGLSVAFKHTNIFNPEGMGGWGRDGVKEVDIVSGCFLMIRKDLWVTLGGFLDAFFMYGEEADLCLRARKLGARPIVTSDATIIHYGGASERVFASKVVKLLKAKRMLIDLHFPVQVKNIGKGLLFLWPVRRYCMHAVLAAFGRRASIEARGAWLEAVRRYREWW